MAYRRRPILWSEKARPVIPPCRAAGSQGGGEETPATSYVNTRLPIVDRITIPLCYNSKYSAPTEARKGAMNRSKIPDFAERIGAAAEAKKAQLERATRAKSEADSPAAIERRAALGAITMARDARAAGRKAAKLVMEADQVASLAAAQKAEAAPHEAAQQADQAASDAEFAERTAREAEESERQASRDLRYAARKARKRKGK